MKKLSLIIILAIIIGVLLIMPLLFQPLDKSRSFICPIPHSIEYCQANQDELYTKQAIDIQ